MLTGSLKSFQTNKRVMTGLVLVGPLLLMGAAYLWVDRVLLVPRVPDETNSALDCVAFISHERGLARLSRTASEAYLLQQTQRLIGDPNFARQFAAAVRTSTAAEQAAFHGHVFDAFKPLLMRDVETWRESAGAQRARFLDERIVAYNRMSRIAASAPTAGVDLGPGISVDRVAMLKMLMRKTTETERDAVQKYLLALKTRIEQILADPDLHAEFEKRIGISPPG